MFHLWFNTFFVNDYEECVLANGGHSLNDINYSPISGVSSSNGSEGSRRPRHASGPPDHQSNGKQRPTAPSGSPVTLRPPSRVNGEDSGRNTLEASSSNSFVQNSALPSRNASTGRLQTLATMNAAALNGHFNNSHSNKQGNDNNSSHQLGNGHITADTSLADSSGDFQTPLRSQARAMDMNGSSRTGGRRLILTLKKHELDKAHKDKQHKIFSEQFQVRFRWRFSKVSRSYGFK